MFPKPAISGDPVLIGSPDIFESTLTKKEIRNIYLGKKKKWLNGHAIKLTVNDTPEVQISFTSVYLQKTPAQFITFWKNMVFVGQGRFPKFFSNEKELIDYIQSTDGAIGFISTDPPEGKDVRRFIISD
ncbi:MAG: hypothetical protein KJ737_26435 [Proteobacteria bacterium]|nr:hypothetical protein [Pseudomonadota bacterium]